MCTSELVSHQHHCQILVDAAHPAAVDLDKLQSRRLEELLKHHPVVTLNRRQAPLSISSQASLLLLEVSNQELEIPALLLPRQSRVEPEPGRD